MSPRPSPSVVPRRPTRVGLAAAVVLPLLLTGCVDDGRPGGSASGSGTPAPTTSAPAVAPDRPVAFSLPESCDDMLPADRLARFAADGLVLLGGPGGLYGTDYFPDRTPEERLGGMTCVWGVDADVRSVIAVSVAPLTAGDRDAVIAGLTDQGLNERVEGDTAVYAQLGDEESSSAQLNVLRGDSWISVLPAAGGEAVFDEATRIADDAALSAYGAG